ncbi:NAD(P)-binding domain-containing protein [Parvularcula marina]|uniref:NAD(P)-binding domain-containing protein n=1 Tax=Parvularcula marina TaxID=2292771 RepID=UPI0035162F3C
MSDNFKVAIIGSGPAGLSAAARAAALGMSHVLLEKTDHLSDTIYKYQKGKHIMATPDQLVLRSDMSFAAGKREDILGTWDSQTLSQKVNVKLNAEVIDISGSKGNFKIQLKGGDEISAENIVLGIGTQGNPNKLRCPGGDQPFVGYQLDDPAEHLDKHIIVVGGGDAGIENALGLANPDLGNTVTLLQRSDGFPRSKPANVALLEEARADGRLDFLISASPKELLADRMIVEAKDGEIELPCDMVIARLGSAPPRKLIEGWGIEFTGPDREAYPILSEEFESVVPGIFVIGALAGYPLIKHCMNQGYDVIERINGNKSLKPADQPLLEAIFKKVPGGKDVDYWIDHLRKDVPIFEGVSRLQMREFLLDSRMHAPKADEIIFRRNQAGSSLWAVVDGSVQVEINPNDTRQRVELGAGQIFGEIGLISGRPRSATIRAGRNAILIEVPRSAALKLIDTIPAVKRKVDTIATERQIRQIFGNSLDVKWIEKLIANAEYVDAPAGMTIIEEGSDDLDVYIIRYGSALVEKNIGGKDVFLSYVPAGAYVGEMALFENRVRTASVKTAIKSQLIRLSGEIFEELLSAEPELRERIRETVVERRRLNAFVESKKDNFDSVSDYYSQVADFLISEGLGEATDALLIDESLCVACDNCELACAETHQGISRLDREAGQAYESIHVPTSCRHCEHPHCMTDCPPDAIHRGADGEVFIDETCIGCGNCQRYCPYGVIQMQKIPPKRPGLFAWFLFGSGPGPGQPSQKWINQKTKGKDVGKFAVKCDMCKGIKGGPACVRACPTGAAIRVSPENYLNTVNKNGGGQ